MSIQWWPDENDLESQSAEDMRHSGRKALYAVITIVVVIFMVAVIKELVKYA